MESMEPFVILTGIVLIAGMSKRIRHRVVTLPLRRWGTGMASVWPNSTREVWPMLKELPSRDAYAREARPDWRLVFVRMMSNRGDA